VRRFGGLSPAGVERLAQLFSPSIVQGNVHCARAAREPDGKLLSWSSIWEGSILGGNALQVLEDASLGFAMVGYGSGLAHPSPMCTRTL